ncbi:MAG: glycosyltransferase [Bacteroidetes bacterium]|nr:glycosyltransferase [Bacteroidota bacterium]
MPGRSVILTVTNDLTYDQRMQRICTSLSQSGYAVTLVGRERAQSLPLDDFPFEQVRLKCWFDKGKLFYLEYNIRLFLYLLTHRRDIVCAIDLDTIVACYYAALLRRSWKVYDAHEYFPEVPEVVRRPRIRAMWQWVERTYVPKMDLVYTTTQSISEILRNSYKKEVATIRNLPLTNTEQTKAKEQKRYLLYQGALNEGRGLEHLIDAVAEMDTELWLVGDGDMADALKARVAAVGADHKIKFTGYVKPADLKKITEDALIGINLLEMKGLSYYYSLANKFLDYIQAGVPQVCIDFPEYQRINDQYHVALLVDNLETDTIKNALKRLTEDKDFYAKMQENCLVCRQELTWQKEEKKLIALYDRLY